MRQQFLKTKTGTLEYTVTTRPRVTRRLHLELDQHGGLVVVAPSHWPERYIKVTMAKNMASVRRFLAKSRGQRLEPLRYVAREEHLYLGRLYPLVLKKSEGKKTRVVIADDQIWVSTSSTTPDSVRTSLQKWYAGQAWEIFDERLSVLA